ncbi:NAD-dependent epimerase/dehydratase family protein [Altibacter lentus]|uniref:NAD-dependent epimerase/dehydratase family protein n=1 Tax=Altibacter lentus TaxID=1223410 RepID=UPI00054F8FA9|nr:NAD(P)-dependent oxidoreductase [Altibacter lentus]
MKIAVTGATGFVGRMLVKKHLQEGNHVHILSRKDLSQDNDFKKTTIHNGGLSDVTILKGFLKNTDVLYHCAAELLDTSKMVATNIDGTNNLIEAAKGNVKHWIQLSSVGVYGPVYYGTVTENQPCHPISLYEKTKLQADLNVIRDLNLINISFTIIRPSNIIGRSMTNQSVYKLIEMVDRKMFFYIGKKGAIVNYVPVDNVVQALFLAAINDNAKDQIFNVSSWDYIENFIGFVALELKKPIPKYRIPKKLAQVISLLLSIRNNNPLTESRINALTTKVIYSSNKIETFLNFSPVKSIESAISEMVEVYKDKG